MHTRRRFLLQPALIGLGALSIAARRLAAADPLLAESEPSALALSYVEDASKVDKAKFSTYKADQNCSSCALFQGGAKDASGGCVLFPGRQVKATGWCSSWSYDA